MKASIFKMLFLNVIVVSAIVMATSVVWVTTTAAGSVPDDNVCTNAGLYCNAEALCKAYIYHMQCSSNDPKASAEACAKVLENFLAVSDKPMPSLCTCPSDIDTAVDNFISFLNNYSSEFGDECYRIITDGTEDYLEIEIEHDCGGILGKIKGSISWQGLTTGEIYEMRIGTKGTCQEPGISKTYVFVDQEQLLCCQSDHYQMVIDILTDVGALPCQY